jgi:hypothetical protein
LNGNVKAENDLKLIPMKNLTITIFIILLAFSALKGSAGTFLFQSEVQVDYLVKNITSDSLLIDILEDYIEIYSSTYKAEIEIYGVGFSEFSEKNHIIRVFQDSNSSEGKNIIILSFYFFSEIPFSDIKVLFYKNNYFYYKQDELSGIVIPERLMVPERTISEVIDSNFRDDYFKEICVIRVNSPMAFHYKIFDKTTKQECQISRKIYTYLEMLDPNLWPIKIFNSESQILITSSTDSDLESVTPSEGLRKLHSKQFRKGKRKALKNTKYLRKVIDKWVILY